MTCLIAIIALPVAFAFLDGGGAAYSVAPRVQADSLLAGQSSNGAA